MRTIRSFVRREGRMTCAQQAAFTAFWPAYGIDVTSDTVLDFARIFGRDAAVDLEIGFGNGEALIAMALAHPEINFVGVEVYQSGMGALFQTLKAQDITNVRVMCVDVMLLLSGAIPLQSLAHIYIYFPDPWQKRKHHKRRLIQADFLDQLSQVLAPEGCVHFATDWLDYARHARRVFSEHPAFHLLLNPNTVPGYCPRPTTRFYRRAIQLGHVITDLSLQRNV